MALLMKNIKTDKKANKPIRTEQLVDVHFRLTAFTYCNYSVGFDCKIGSKSRKGRGSFAAEETNRFKLIGGDWKKMCFGARKRQRELA